MGRKCSTIWSISHDTIHFFGEYVGHFCMCIVYVLCVQYHAQFITSGKSSMPWDWRKQGKIFNYRNLDLTGYFLVRFVESNYNVLCFKTKTFVDVALFYPVHIFMKTRWHFKLLCPSQKFICTIYFKVLMAHIYPTYTILVTNSWCAERGGRISQVVPPPSAQKSADNGGRLPIKVVATTIAQRSVYAINTTKKRTWFQFLKIFSFNPLDCALLQGLIFLAFGVEISSPAIHTLRLFFETRQKMWKFRCS